MRTRTVRYRPEPKWRAAVAFAGAIVIHLSAVAFASHHGSPPPVGANGDFSPIEIDSSAEPAVASQAEPPISMPVTVPPAEFAETSPPERPLSNRRVLPIRAIGRASLSVVGHAKASALYAPLPEYPYEARSRRQTGSGVAVINLDSSSGFVESVAMERSIGAPILDNATVSAFKRWRFKKNTPSTVRVPITFDLTGPRF